MIFKVKIFEKQKTSLQSPSLVSRATTSSPGRIDIKFGYACKAENPMDPTLNSENLRFAVAPDLSNRPGELSVTLKAKLGDR